DVAAIRWPAFTPKARDWFSLENGVEMRNKIILATLFGLLAASACVWFRKQPPLRPLPKFLSYDHFHGPTDGWNGPKFELSQDYPREQPPSERHPWEAINFKQDARSYLVEVLRYLYEGNIEVDWVVQKNPARPWFHAPWMDAAEIKKQKNPPTEHCRDEKG